MTIHDAITTQLALQRRAELQRHAYDVRLARRARAVSRRSPHAVRSPRSPVPRLSRAAADCA